MVLLYLPTFNNSKKVVLPLPFPVPQSGCRKPLPGRGDMLQIEMLQAAIARVMKQNHNDHNFCFRKRTITMVFPLLSVLNGVLIHHCIIKYAKIICNIENISNFVLGKH